MPDPPGRDGLARKIVAEGGDKSSINHRKTKDPRFV